MIQITSSRNPLIKDVKSLYRKKERKKQKMFLIEGIKIIEEAIEHSYSMEDIIYSDALLESQDGERLFSKIKTFDKLTYVSKRILKEISDTENPQGIIARANLVFRDMEEIDGLKNKSLLLLDGVQDPGNMGTIIRSADAFSMDGIIIKEGSVDPYNPKVIRATMGSIFRVPIFFMKGIEELKTLKSKNIDIYSTSLEGSIPVHENNFHGDFILSIGNESQGISDEISALSDKLIKIPMTGKAESLNAGVAASIIMYEAIRQRIL